MKILKITGAVLIAGVVLTFAPEIGERIFLSKSPYLVPTAEAVVGRPLTPVSVAGVARRTVRRCAVGVYCGLPGSNSPDILLGRKSSEPIFSNRYKEVSNLRPTHVQPHITFDLYGSEAG